MTLLRRDSVVISAALLLGALLLGGPRARAQGSYKTAAAPAPSGSDISPALVSQLNPQGVRVVDGSGTTLCEVWTLKSVSLSGGGGDIYPDLGTGTLIGVIHFPAATTDFRRSSLKPGYYTLRYGTMPQDGDHMGVNPYRDFLVLLPVATDTQLGQLSNFESLTKTSEKATTTGHPAIMSLVPVSGSTFPSVIQTSDGYTALQLKLSGSSASGPKDLPIALVVVGQTTAQT